MSTENDYTFSVIIPSYNRARFLPQALESIWQQDMAGVQVIVVDDGSTDDTRAVVARYGHKVHYLYQENRGTASARNASVRLARGRLVSFLDSDDLWLPGKMQAELALFHELPMTDAIVSDAERWMEGELVSPSWFKQVGFVLSPGQPELMSRHPPPWVKRKPFATCSLTIRRTALEQLGAVPFDTSLGTHEDWDLAIRMHRACRVLIVPQVFAHVRRFNDGTRVSRPLPGTPYPPEVERVMMYRRYRILNRALAMEGWPKEVVKEVESVAGETARKMVANYRGWRRPGLLTVVASEMRRGAVSTMFRVLALSLRVPWRGSPINTGSVHG